MNTQQLDIGNEEKQRISHAMSRLPLCRRKKNADRERERDRRRKRDQR